MASGQDDACSDVYAAVDSSEEKEGDNMFPQPRL